MEKGNLELRIGKRVMIALAVVLLILSIHGPPSLTGYSILEGLEDAESVSFDEVSFDDFDDLDSLEFDLDDFSSLLDEAYPGPLILRDGKGRVVTADVDIIDEDLAGRKRVEVIPRMESVKRIEFDDLALDNSAELRIEDLSEEQFTQSYAIDPTGLNFTSATVTVQAKGHELYKCAEWDFDKQTCDGSWSLFKKGLTPGQNYTFTLSRGDPGFGEIIITKAKHLDENRTFVSDIYGQVRDLDGVWSETILDGEFVRVTFEKKLTAESIRLP